MHMSLYFIQHLYTTRDFDDATRAAAHHASSRYQSVEPSGNLFDNVTQVQSARIQSAPVPISPPRGSLRDAHACVSHRNGCSCHFGFGTISKSSDFGSLLSRVPTAVLEGSIIIVAPNGALGGGGSALGGSGRA